MLWCVLPAVTQGARKVGCACPSPLSFLTVAVWTKGVHNAAIDVVGLASSCRGGCLYAARQRGLSHEPHAYNQH